MHSPNDEPRNGPPDSKDEDAVNELYKPMFLPDLLIAALERNGESPAVHIGEDVLTAAQLRDQVSRYVQAFEDLGVRQGEGVATLSKNRVEVLFSMGAVMVSGCRNTPLHPLGSLDDHAYVLEDGEIETLLYDPAFAEHARELKDRVPGLRWLLSYGPTDGAENLVGLAATFEPRQLVPPEVGAEDLSALAYTGGTTGKPKGVMNTYRGSAAMAQIMVSEWQWPDEVRHLICTPLSHAGSSFFVPLLLRRVDVRATDVRRGRCARGDRKVPNHDHHARPINDLRPTRPSEFRQTDLSSLQTVFYGASAMSPTRLKEAIEKLGPIFFQFYGQTEAVMTVCVLRKEEHRR